MRPPTSRSKDQQYPHQDNINIFIKTTNILIKISQDNCDLDILIKDIDIKSHKMLNKCSLVVWLLYCLRPSLIAYFAINTFTLDTSEVECILSPLSSDVAMID